MTAKEFRSRTDGSWAAFITNCRSTSVEHQLRLGAKGFYVGGSTGEGFLLATEERKLALEQVVRANAARGTVIAHIGSISTGESVQLARHAESLGVDAVSAVVPFYYKLSMTEIERHYEQIMDAASLPMIIYHFPGATGVQLTLDFYSRMSKHPQCIGVKFTSLNLFDMQQIRSLCGPDFLKIIADMIRIDVFAYEKYVMALQGVFETAAIRHPLKQLTAEEKMHIETFYRGNAVLQACRLRKDS